MSRALVFERDVEIPMRDGLSLRANVYRPLTKDRLPVIMTLGPYGKDIPLALHDKFRGTDHFTKLGGGVFLNWETPDPEYWVARGYVVVRVDSRGSGTSPGVMGVFSAAQAVDYYDAIEWAAEQGWSSGRIGLLGISYYAMSQWAVAALRPPHLTAMIPWEGASDDYREIRRHGGILSSTFIKRWEASVDRVQFGRGSLSEAELTSNRVSVWDQAKAHPLDDEAYSGWFSDLSAIDVPFLSVGNWGNLLLHLRGNIEAFVQASSRQKWLRIIVGDHVEPFYSPAGLAWQERFFGHFLRGEDTGWLAEPRVRYARRRGDDIEWRDAEDWPLPGTQWTSYALDAGQGSLSMTPPSASATAAYDAPTGDIEFDSGPLDQELEIAGPVVLRLWVSSQSPDMDLYVWLRDLAPDGSESMAVSPVGDEQPLAQGWLRVSHRKLDPVRCLRHRPFHAHDEEELLQRGEVVPVDVEIWPTSIVVQPGHHLVLGVSAHDHPKAHMPFGTDADDRPPERFDGRNWVHTGPGHPSCLLLPVIPSS
jgi:predicted acyl esterase